MSDPGWYHDPADTGQLRFWDGTSWTDRTAPLPGGAPTAEQPGRRRPPVVAIVGVAVLLVSLAIVGTLLAVNRTSESTTASPPASTSPSAVASTTTVLTTSTTPLPTEQDILNANVPGDLPQSCDPADRLDLRDGGVSGSTVLNGVSYRWGCRLPSGRTAPG